MKCPELGHQLFQFFVDAGEVHRSRMYSIMLMQKARSLREEMQLYGVDVNDLPELGPAAGKQWFMRWWDRFKVKKHAKVSHVKASWKKIKNRTRVVWSNRFRLMYHWKTCFHHSTDPRFVSWDQAPSHFNNVGTPNASGLRSRRYLPTAAHTC